MFAELVSAVKSVQALSSLLTSANKLSNYNEIVLAVSEINLKLIEANSHALASQEIILSQKNQIEKLENQIKFLNE